MNKKNTKRIKDTVLMSSFDIQRQINELPQTLINGYNSMVKFRHVHLENFNNLPIPNGVYELIMSYRDEGCKFSFEKYLIAFLEGYYSKYPKLSLKSNCYNKKVIIYRLFGTRKILVKRRYEEGKPYFHDFDLHILGFKIGQVYKQWIELFNDEALQYILDDVIKKDAEKDEVQTTGFNSNFSQNQIGLLCHKLIESKFLDVDTDIEFFKSIFTNKAINQDNDILIKWNETIPLFCALMYGFSEVKLNDKIIEFQGVLLNDNLNKYQKTLKFFKFNGTVTNKVLSEKTAKLQSSKTRNLSKLYEIIKTVQASTV